MKRGVITTTLAVITGLLLTIAVLFALVPSSGINVFLSMRPLLAQVYAFPLALGCAIGIVALIVLLVGCGQKKQGGWKKPSFLMGISLLFIGGLFVSAAFEFGDHQVASSAKSEFRLVEWNAANSFNREIAQAVFGDYGADIAVFPELGDSEKEALRERLSAAFSEAGLNLDDYDVFSSLKAAGHIAPVTVIVKKKYAHYHVTETAPMTLFGTVYLASSDNSTPDLICVHTAPPLPGLMQYWRDDLAFVSSLAERNRESLIIGDFNATMRHGELGKIDTHYDASPVGVCLRNGTWPTRLPNALAASIDHVLLPSNSFAVNHIDVVNLSGSDHKAIFVEIGRM